MSHGNRYFWLKVATHWIKVVTLIATLLLARSGFHRIDSVMISGTSDWHEHAPLVAAGVGCFLGAVSILIAGFAIVDLIRLLLDCDLQLHKPVKETALPKQAASPLPTSQALLESLGIPTARPAPAASRVRHDA